MDPQILHSAFQQQRAHGVGHATDSDLKTGAILDFGGNAPCHDAVNVVRLRIRQLGAGLVIPLNDEIDLADVHTVFLAECVRHFTIDLDYCQLRLLDYGALPETRRAEVEVAAVVHRTSLENGDVNGIKK